MTVNKVVFEQRRLARRMRDEGLGWVEIAERLRAAYPGLNALAAMRQAHGWSQAEAARQWCRRWPDQVVTQKNFTGWETWQKSRRTPSLRVLDRLAELYECSASDLLAGWADYTPATGRRDLGAGYGDARDLRSTLTVLGRAGVAAV